ncbi:MAG: hypothetical protein Q7S53_02345 [bacterium]|nr:hypothetical protein [bacterium]
MKLKLGPEDLKPGMRRVKYSQIVFDTFKEEVQTAIKYVGQATFYANEETPVEIRKVIYPPAPLWMSDYIRKVQRYFIDKLDYPEDPNKPGMPVGVPDGEYPMLIEGRLDKVRIVDGGNISCCNFGE